MSREICIFQDFLTDEHKAKIQETAAAAGMTPHFFQTTQFQEAQACLQHCEVLYGDSVALLRTAPATLRWFCSSSAGVDGYCRDGVFANPDCLLSNCNGYGVTIAEYTVMVALMLLRQLPAYAADLQVHRWPAEHLPVRSIRGCRLTILGTGNIGTTVAQRMRDMGAAHIVGVNHSGHCRTEDVYDAVYPLTELDGLLREAELLVLALPATAETNRILSRERIALLPKDAVVINVGRGNAVDQTALVEALNQGRIAGAGLDVMEPEPLPADDPLWSAKNLVLTPHIAGNLTLGYTCDVNVEMFCEDLLRYAAGQPLLHRVDRSRGY